MRRSSIAAYLLAALLCAELHAASDDSSSSVALPLVMSGADRSTSVTIANHGHIDVELLAFAVQGTAAGVAAQISCVDPAGNAWVVPALGHVSFDLDRSCGLGTRPFAGAFYASAATSGVQHLSAAATLHFLDRTGRRAHSLEVNGVTLAAFAGADAPIEAQGLRNDPGLSLRSACQVVTATARGRALAVGELTLLDATGNTLGNSLSIKVAGQQVQRIDDVFAAAGLGGQTLVNVRAAYRPMPMHDVGVVLSCDSESVAPSSGVSSVVQLAGTPAAGASSTRRHLISSAAARRSTLLEISGTQNDVLLIWVRQQDRFRCNAASLNQVLNGNLMITVVDPGKSKSFTNGTSNSPLIDTNTKATQNAGVSDAWALLVEQINPDPSQKIPYSVSCRSGNGTSMPVLMYRSDKPMSRPPP